MEEDEEDEEMGGWEFDAPAPPAIIRAPHHHHHHHAPPRALGDMFTMLGGGDPYRCKFSQFTWQDFYTDILL